MEDNKKGYQTIAISTEENGGNHIPSESEKSEQNQPSESQYNTEITDKKEAENTNVVYPSKALEVYSLLLAVIKAHIACEDYQAMVVVLWIMKTWCTGAFKVAPILVIMAMTKGAGKTQLLYLISLLSRDSLYTADITPAALYRYVDMYGSTLCLDEADSFGIDKLRGLLNSGFNEGGCVVRCIGPDNEPVKFNTFGDKAIAGIGATLPETVEDRSIIMKMRRKRKNDVKLKVYDIKPLEIKQLIFKVKRWASEAVGVLSEAKPVMPNGLSDRKEDCWRPILAIAELIGEDVAQQSREAAILISGKDNDQPSIYEELLKGIKNIFEQRERVHISTQNLIAELCEDVEAPWRYYDKGRPITPRQLAHILKQFGVFSRQIRIDNTKTLKGYLKVDLLQCFSDYLI